MFLFKNVYGYGLEKIIFLNLTSNSLTAEKIKVPVVHLPI